MRLRAHDRGRGSLRAASLRLNDDQHHGYDTEDRRNPVRDCVPDLSNGAPGHGLCVRYHGCSTRSNTIRRACARTAWVGRVQTTATAGPARPRTLTSAQRPAAPQHSRWYGRAHRRMRAKRSSVHGHGARDVRRERRTEVALHFCPIGRSAGAATSGAAGAAAVAVGVHLCDGGATTAAETARWRRVGTRVDWSCNQRCCRSGVCTLGRPRRGNT